MKNRAASSPRQPRGSADILATTIEIPYANVKGRTVTAAAGTFGRDLARTLRRYLLQIDEHQPKGAGLKETEETFAHYLKEVSGRAKYADPKHGRQLNRQNIGRL